MPKFISDAEMQKLESQQPKKQPKFISDEEMIKLEGAFTRKVSPTEAAVRGAIQGASLGFADEITGAASAAFKTITGPKKLTDIVDTYKEERDASRQAYKAAEEQNPASYIGGEVAGTVGTMFVPGLNVAKGASLAAQAGKAAAAGAASALGSSEADNIKDTAKDVAVGAGLGAGTVGAMAGLSKIIPGTSKALQSVNKWFQKASEPDSKSVSNILNKAATTGIILEYVIPGYGPAAATAKGAYDIVLKNPEKFLNTVKKIEESKLPQATKELLIRSLPKLTSTKKED